MLIYAPKRQQTQGSSQPAFVHLDVAGRQIVGHNGARFQEPHEYSSDRMTVDLPGDPVGWCTVDGETLLVAIKGNSDKPMHFHFK